MKKFLTLMLAAIMLLSLASFANAEETTDLVMWIFPFSTDETAAQEREMYETMCAEFTAANPGINVTMEIIPWPNRETKMLTAIAANAGPDIMYLNSDILKLFQAYGVLAPITEYVSEEKIELVANDNYWDGAPEIKSITVKNIGSDTKADAMLSGDIDLAQGPDATSLSRVENNDEINIVKVTGTRENDFELNCHEGYPLSDKNLRLALSYAVDRDVVAQVAGNGYSSPIGTAFPPSVGYDSDKVTAQTYDLEKANECLEAAGYSDSDGDGENLSLTISVSNGSSTAVCETLQDMWKQIGVDVQIEMLENISDKRAAGDFDILVSPNWQTVNAGDGQKYLMNRWSDGGSDNYSGYHSDDFQAVLDKLDAAFTQEDRVSAFVEAQQILADDAPAIWMYANENVTLVNSKIENVTVFPIDYYLVTNKWTLAE